MRGAITSRIGVAVLLVLGTPMSIRAEIVNWSYTWTAIPDVVTADAGDGKLYFNKATGGQLSGTIEVDTDDSETKIVAANLTATTTAPTTSPDYFTNRPFKLSLVVTDDFSGEVSNPLVFRGRIDGKLTARGKSTLTATIRSADLEKAVRLGDHFYTITMISTVDVSPPTGGGVGAIGAKATVQIQKVPEPGAILLALLGVGMFWFTLARRRPVFSF